MEEMIDGREDEKSVTWAVNDLGSVDYDYHPEARQLFWITLVAGLLSVMPAAGAMMLFNAWVISCIIGDVRTGYFYADPAYNVMLVRLDRIFVFLYCFQAVCMLAFVVLAAVQLRAHKPQGLLTCRLLLWFLTIGWTVALLFSLLIWLDSASYKAIVIVAIVSLFLFYLVKGLRLSYRSQDMQELYPSWYRGRSAGSWLIASICIFAPALLGAFLALGI